MEFKKDQTFDINDLYASSSDKLGKQEDPHETIQNELKQSEIYQKNRLTHKVVKKLHYQKEIENLRKKLKEPYKCNDIHFYETISHTKNELQNSENLSQSLNKILSDEKALKSRIYENSNKTKTVNFIKKEEIEKELEKLKENTFEESLKKMNEIERNKQKISDSSSNRDNEIEEMIIKKPNHENPFKNILKFKKDEEEQRKEILEEIINSNKELEKKKLFQRYVKLLKMNKKLIESTVDQKENFDLEKIFNEITELKKINEKLIEEVKHDKIHTKKENLLKKSEIIPKNMEEKYEINEKFEGFSNSMLSKNKENNVKDVDLRNMIDKVKNGVRKTLSSNPKSNISRIKNEQKTHTRKKSKPLYCDECDYLLNKGKNTSYCQIHGKCQFKSTIPRRLAMIS